MFGCGAKERSEEPCIVVLTFYLFLCAFLEYFTFAPLSVAVCLAVEDSILLGSANQRPFLLAIALSPV